MGAQRPRPWRARSPADLGCTPVYLHYNSGRHVSTNGREFAGLLEALAKAWPVPVDEIAIVAHSMGGLLARSAFHYARAARHKWPARVTKIVFLGTPHDGAPLERGGNWIDYVLDASPYTTAFARLGKLRSAGITDLRHGSVLDEDWGGKDRFARSTRAAVKRHFVPLPAGVKCFAVAASLAKKSGSLADRLVGDGLVPVHSALGHGASPKSALAFPATQQWIGYGMGHLDLLGRPGVYAQIRRWLAWMLFGDCSRTRPRMSLEEALRHEGARCPWCLGSPEYIAYHDREWGRPVHDDRVLFEFLILEGAQAGLSWSTILPSARTTGGSSRNSTRRRWRASRPRGWRSCCSIRASCATA